MIGLGDLLGNIKGFGLLGHITVLDIVRASELLQEQKTDTECLDIITSVPGKRGRRMAAKAMPIELKAGAFGRPF